MKRMIPILLAGALTLLGCARTAEMIPPTVTLRDIANMERIADGEIIDFTESTCLFLPSAWTPPESNEIKLTAHFHGTPWFPMEEHARRGSTNPLFIFGGLQGSSSYREPHLDRDLFARQIDQVEQALRERGASANAQVTTVEVQSFSAGYGAVREILKSPAYVDLIDTVVLADSMYASFTSDSDHRPLPEDVAPFIEYARLAAAGEKTFLIAHAAGTSPSYACTTECAQAVLEGIGESPRDVTPEAPPGADLNLDYPLITQTDLNGLHVWGYAGSTPEAHMAMARTLAELWWAIEDTQ